MIIDSFDNKSKPFLTAEQIYGSKERNDIVYVSASDNRIGK